MKNLSVLKPRLSEKAYGLSQTASVYVFQVPGDANKHTIADAVAEQFSVTVLGVNTTTITGKRKRTYTSRSGKFVRGQRSDIKKAYVTLKAGDTIPIFAADEEMEQKQEEQSKQLKKLAEKADKKTEKAAKKESK